MIPKADLKIETMRGTGPGGQRKNKLETACRITHVPSGISAYADERSQSVSKRKALQELERRLRDVKSQQRAAAKKRRRDVKIHDRTVVRTYSYVRNTVKDHRTGKVASLKEVLRGKLELVQ